MSVSDSGSVAFQASSPVGSTLMFVWNGSRARWSVRPSCPSCPSRALDGFRVSLMGGVDASLTGMFLGPAANSRKQRVNPFSARAYVRTESLLFAGDKKLPDHSVLWDNLVFWTQKV